jgi:hypothetical protein
MRRRAQAESAEDVAEHRLLVLFADAERSKNLRLQIPFVDSDAASAELDPV